MARPRKKSDHDTGQIKAKDPALVKRLYLNDIKPNRAKIGEISQENSTAFKEIKKQGNIQRGAADLVFKIFEMEDAKRDDWLRGFHMLLEEFNIPFPPRDLVDAMTEGQDGYARPKPALVAVPTGPAGDPDLAGED